VWREAVRKSYSDNVSFSDWYPLSCRASKKPRMKLLNRALKTNFCFLFLFFGLKPLCGALPLLISFQGHVLNESRPFVGTGQFKFAIVNQGDTTLWRNDGLTTDGEPAKSLEIQVVRGVFAVMLGDDLIVNMAPLNPGLFDQDYISIRIWFDAGDGVFEQLSPDTRITSVGFAINALKAKTVDELPDGIVTEATLGQGLREAIELNTAKTGITPNQATDIDSNTTQVEINRVAIAQLQQQLAALQGTGGGGGAVAGAMVASASASDSLLGLTGYKQFTKVKAPPWRNGNVNGQPSPRHRHAGAWTGSRFLVWGGNLGGNYLSGDGGIYDPASDSWSLINPFGSPTARDSHTAVWSGRELVVWGGFGQGEYLSSGSGFNPAQGTWRSISTSGQPSARIGHTSVLGKLSLVQINHSAGYDWETTISVEALADGVELAKGNKLGFTGGAEFTLTAGASTGATQLRGYLAGGAVGDDQEGYLGNESVVVIDHTAGYSNIRTLSVDSIDDTLSKGTIAWFSNGASVKLTEDAQSGATEIKGTLSGGDLVDDETGRRHTLMMWGGKNNKGLLGDGGIYDPFADTWSSIGASGAPSPRSGHTAVWVDGEFIVWGGDGAEGVLNSGAKYSSVGDSWAELPTSGAPSARRGHSAIFSGSKMIIWGGESEGGLLGDGAVFDSSANDGAGSWTAMATLNAPIARSDHSAVWTGSEMILYGGKTAQGETNTTAAYDPAANSWRPLGFEGAPLARRAHLAFWTGQEMLIYGGLLDEKSLSSLQRLDPERTWYFYRKD
jgi:N-acetylneuraminic acid mutarotase